MKSQKKQKAIRNQEANSLLKNKIAQAKKRKKQTMQIGKLYTTSTIEKAREMCNCGKCQRADKCNYKDKYQRFPRELYRGASGLCPKIKNERF